MADLVLERGLELGGGTTHLRQPEVRVIAKTIRSSGRVNDRAWPSRLCNNRIWIGGRTKRHQNAGVVGGPISDIVQLTQQLGVVLGVRGSLTGKPRRSNPWRAIERHAADTGVVGKRRQPSFCR